MNSCWRRDSAFSKADNEFLFRFAIKGSNSRPTHANPAASYEFKGANETLEHIAALLRLHSSLRRFGGPGSKFEAEATGHSSDCAFAGQP
jgi:hypothetical protein